MSLKRVSNTKLIQNKIKKAKVKKISKLDEYKSTISSLRVSMEYDKIDSEIKKNRRTLGFWFEVDDKCKDDTMYSLCVVDSFYTHYGSFYHPSRKNMIAEIGFRNNVTINLLNLYVPNDRRDEMSLKWSWTKDANRDIAKYGFLVGNYGIVPAIFSCYSAYHETKKSHIIKVISSIPESIELVRTKLLMRAHQCTKSIETDNNERDWKVYTYIYQAWSESMLMEHSSFPKGICSQIADYTMI